jgi:hypothetical protein
MSGRASKLLSEDSRSRVCSLCRLEVVKCQALKLDFNHNEGMQERTQLLGWHRGETEKSADVSDQAPAGGLQLMMTALPFMHAPRRIMCNCA